MYYNYGIDYKYFYYKSVEEEIDEAELCARAL